ncbi:Subtilisin DY [Cytospora mali]|uniref:Subtilisin DY n=1 Tax=Cytospora mali TaxID=578113 RepID=A0A194VZV9_CYTMA|nr:Subtilisin DY [Valsa mali]
MDTVNKNLLAGFNVNTVQKLWDRWTGSSMTASKVYFMIENAVEKVSTDECWGQNETWTDSTMSKFIFAEKRDPIVDDFTRILKFKETRKSKLKKASLFAEAIENFKMFTNVLNEAKDNEGKQDDEVREQAWKFRAAYTTVQALCLNQPKMAFENEDTRSITKSGFQCAAEAGAEQLLQIMIEELLKSLQRETVQDINVDMLNYMSKPFGGKTALHMAVDKGRLGVIEALLCGYPRLANYDCVSSAIANTVHEKKIEARERALKAFKLLTTAMGSRLDSERVWAEAVEISSPTVVKHLLEGANSAKFAIYRNARIIVEKGDVTTWKMFSNASRDEFMSTPGCDLLHMAVKSGKAEIIDAILEEYPDKIEVKIQDNGLSKYPIQYLANNSSNGPIRSRLVDAMIKRPNLGIQEIRRILKTVEGEVSDKIFRFERVLKYANFPDLDIAPAPKTIAPTMSTTPTSALETDTWRQDHTEIKGVLDWLKKRRVTTILNLSVSDRLHCPHSDDVVASCINGFGIRVLKWKKLDLYLGNLDEKAKEQLQELHLYSSGKWAVHDEWFQELPKFSNDVLSENRVKAVTKALQEKISIFKKGPEQFGNQGRPITIQHDQDKSNKEAESRSNANGSFVQPINSNSVKADGKLEIIVTKCSWATEQGHRIDLDHEDIPYEVVGKNLQAFLEKFRNYYVVEQETPPARTKVALIDSGVLVTGGPGEVYTKENAIFGKNPAHRIVDGTSLVSKDNKEEVYWHASDPHGSQMAQLICSINPCCDLYVVKVVERRDEGISANNIAEAIDWAMKKGVDIISMSLVTFRDDGETLVQAIRQAKQNDIVIISSTADEGFRPDKSTTSEGEVKDKLFSISACNSNGSLLDQSQKEGYHFSFLGDNVSVEPVPFLQSRTRIRGSSVATAIAAGTAALAVACCRISENCNTNSSMHWRYDMVKKTFKSMALGVAQGLPWVDLERFCCERDELVEAFDFKATVDRYFQRS